jgi:hypothetical protein
VRSRKGKVVWCGLKEKEDRLPIHACCCRCVREKKGGRGFVLMFEEGEGESGGCQELVLVLLLL